jgi:hypothetical protein
MNRNRTNRNSWSSRNIDRGSAVGGANPDGAGARTSDLMKFRHKECCVSETSCGPESRIALIRCNQTTLVAQQNHVYSEARSLRGPNVPFGSKIQTARIVPNSGLDFCRNSPVLRSLGTRLSQSAKNAASLNDLKRSVTDVVVNGLLPEHAAILVCILLWQIL